METLSKDQQHVLAALIEWYEKDKGSMQYVTLGGYAGTGKTTLIGHFRQELETHHTGIRVAFVSFTGKASRVLSQTIERTLSTFKKDSVGTIHSLIYSPVVNDCEEIVGWKQKDEIECDLIIIDEASMVDGMIWEHLKRYGKPMVVVGDHGQLPPIQGNFNLMGKTDLKLEEIHRQSKDNPIIEVSILARTHGSIPVGRYGKGVVKYNKGDSESQEALGELLSGDISDTLLLCGFNATRKKLNAHMRAMAGIETAEPVSGDRVICLRNNHKKKIFNGMLGTVLHIRSTDSAWYEAEIQMDGEESVYSGLIYKDQFTAQESLNMTPNRALSKQGDLFDFGYALTVHKAQGSQAKRVILMEERFGKMSDDDWKRWLYTGVTRAQEELYIFGYEPPTF